MKKITILLVLFLVFIVGILAGSRLNDIDGLATTPAPVVVEQGKITDRDQNEKGKEEERKPERQDQRIVIDLASERVPVKVKGIYISAYVAGTPSMLDSLLAEIDKTEINTLVIDLKDDFGRVACEMDSPIVEDLGSVRVYIQDMEAMMKKLDDHGLYVIARIPAFRDAWLGSARPDWCIKKSDGTVFIDRDGNSWVNPYKQEAWDYLVELGYQAKKLGFDEVQFDYLRFCTETGMEDVIFDEADVRGRSRTDVIKEFMEYAYERLKSRGLFVSADVFGAIINSDVNANSVGQIYGELAKHVDYISPMVYPSHYGDGYYGIDYPDTHPYETIRMALMDSQKELYFARQDGVHMATVRPWLQDFTATWLPHHIDYGPQQVREQIQATYDAGYDEWLLWDASCRYDWGGLLSPEEAEKEKEQIAQSRAVLPETTFAPETGVSAAGNPETEIVVEVPTNSSQSPAQGGRAETVPVPTGSAGPTVEMYMGD